MKVYIANALNEHPILDFLGGSVGAFQSMPTGIELDVSRCVTDAELILCPHDAKIFRGDERYLGYLKSINPRIPLLIFNRGDFPIKFDHDQIISVQNSVRPGANSRQVVLIPYNVLSLSHLPYRKYSENPVISFVGYVPRITIGRIVRSVAIKPFHPLQNNSALIRRFTVKRSSKLPGSQIKVRGRYGAVINSDEDIFKNRVEYEEILSESDFVLCPRGDANQSQRFYEVLSAGRIPVVPESQIRYPEFSGKRSDFSLLKTKTLGFDIKSKINGLWGQLDHDSYLELQNNNRNAFSGFEYSKFIQELFSEDSQSLRDRIIRG